MSLEAFSVEEEPLVLRLLVSGSSPRSTRAVENLRRILEAQSADRYDLEVIDIYLHPEAARTYQVIAAPTLVRLAPAPVRRFIGDLSNPEKLRASLGLSKLPGAARE